MKVRVLGSAAGGGVPQWNCGCDNCREARRGTGAVRPRTQESVAISADGASWFLLNASPEIRGQIESFPPLTPREPRHSPIAGLVLTNGDLDHCLGLLSLRESHPLTVYATESVRAGFTAGNVLYRTLERFEGQVTWRALAVDREQPLGGREQPPGGREQPPGGREQPLGGREQPPGGREQPPGDSALTITAVATPGNLPLHLKSLREPSAEDNVGLVVRDTRTGKRLAYFSGVAGPSPALARALAEADAIFFDGTFWSSDELIALGLGTRRAEEMSHWPLGGAEGSAAFLARQRGRKILIHVNNTNPILREASAERRALDAAGIEVAADGLELVL